MCVRAVWMDGHVCGCVVVLDGGVIGRRVVHVGIPAMSLAVDPNHLPRRVGADACLLPVPADGCQKVYRSGCPGAADGGDAVCE